MTRAMMSRVDDIIELCRELTKNDMINTAVKRSSEGAAVAGGMAFIGGLIAGPPGILLGGAVGGMFGFLMTNDQFISVPQLINDLSPQQKRELYHCICRYLKNMEWSDVAELVSMVIEDKSLNNEIIGEVHQFIRNKIQLQRD